MTWGHKESEMTACMQGSFMKGQVRLFQQILLYWEFIGHPLKMYVLWGQALVFVLFILVTWRLEQRLSERVLNKTLLVESINKSLMSINYMPNKVAIPLKFKYEALLILHKYRVHVRRLNKQT